jgi:minor extracellular serine protease Vpr
VVSPSTVTVPGGWSRTLTVGLSYSAAALAALPSMGATAPGEVVSFAGAIVATPVGHRRLSGRGGGGDNRGGSPGSGRGWGQWQFPDLGRFFGHGRGKGGQAQTLRVPFLVVPRGLSNITTSAAAPFVGGNSSATATNSGLHEGTADVYAWGLTDPNEGGQPMDIRDVGIQSFPGTYFGSTPDDRGMVFAVNTWGQAANQSVNEFDIDIDTNGDGQTDYVVVGVDLGLVLTGDFNGQYGSFTFDAAGNLIDAWYAEAPMNGSVVELPVLGSDIGLSSASGKFSYTVTGYSIVPGTFIDTTGTASYDPYNPAVNTGQFLDLAPGGSGSIPLSLDAGAQAVTPALGWISVNLDDANGAPQADEIPLP